MIINLDLVDVSSGFSVNVYENKTTFNMNTGLKMKMAKNKGFFFLFIRAKLQKLVATSFSIFLLVNILLCE